jgi:hypothetical protein
MSDEGMYPCNHIICSKCKSTSSKFSRIKGEWICENCLSNECSFCGRSDVDVLIQGPNVQICNYCILTCYNHLLEKQKEK